MSVRTIRLHVIGSLSELESKQSTSFSYSAIALEDRTEEPVTDSFDRDHQAGVMTSFPRSRFDQNSIRIGSR